MRARTFHVLRQEDEKGQPAVNKETRRGNEADPPFQQCDDEKRKVNEETRLQLHLINLACYVDIIAKATCIPMQGMAILKQAATEIYPKYNASIVRHFDITFYRFSRFS